MLTRHKTVFAILASVFTALVFYAGIELERQSQKRRNSMLKEVESRRLRGGGIKALAENLMSSDDSVETYAVDTIYDLLESPNNKKLVATIKETTNKAAAKASAHDDRVMMKSYRAIYHRLRE